LGFANTAGPIGCLSEKGAHLNSHWISDQDPDARLFLGAESYLNSGGYMRGNVLIGRYCSIGRRVTIGAGAHDVDHLTTSPRIMGSTSHTYTSDERTRVYQRSDRGEYTIIESDVWIGDGAVIMQGIRIALGSVIGANAVVVRDTEPYEIVAGVAARSIGTRFDQETVSKLIASQWWEFPPNVINTFPMQNIFEFIKSFSQQSPHHEPFPTWRVSQ